MSEKNPFEVLKYSSVKSLELTDVELALINKQSLRELALEEVFVFKIAACNNLVDRDFERFSDQSLFQMAELFVGKTVIKDHNWRAGNQTARIYAAAVEDMPGATGGKQLVLRVYMLKNADTQSMIDAIEGGILREVSVACRSADAICSICGVNKRRHWCEHRPGADYGTEKCTVLLDKITDAYEVSFVAVPTQPAAGVTKAYGGEDNALAPVSNAKVLENRRRLARKKISIMETEE